MDALKFALKWTLVLILVFVSVAVVVPAENCAAGDWWSCCCCGWHGHGQVFDGTTRCKWSRTWHARNDVMLPLSGFYVPRPIDPCDYNGYHGYGGHHCGDVVAGSYAAECMEHYEAVGGADCSNAPGLHPGFERLGQIPNDLAIAGALPPVSAGDRPRQ
jgi:hypothetical protein